MALAGVPAVADELKNTATSVLSKVHQVQDLTSELQAAEKQLDGAIDQLSNGGPPLESTTPSAPPSPESSVKVGPSVSYP